MFRACPTSRQNVAFGKRRNASSNSDTVRPPAIDRYTVKRLAAAVVLSWPAVRDGGGLSGYRVKVGGRTVTVGKPTIKIARSRVVGPVTITPVDRAGNAGPALVIARSRLR